MSGKTLAKVEVMHWCETVLFLGWTGMFFVWGNPVSILLAIVVALLAWFFEIWIDNNFARVKWQAMLKWAWVVALVCGRRQHRRPDVLLGKEATWAMHRNRPG